MDKQFITDGLHENRYLKAQRLVESFETEVLNRLDTTCQSVRDGHPKLFESEASLSHQRGSGSTLRTIRTEVSMKETDDEGNNLTINVGLEWVGSEEQPGFLANVAEDTSCYVLYKIKYDSESTLEAVEKESKNGDRWATVRFGEEKYDRPPKVAPGIVYWPVETGNDLDEGLDVLKDHFSTVYAPILRS